MRVLKKIFKDINSSEQEFMSEKLGLSEKANKKNIIPRDIFHSIQDLLIYAPEPFLSSIEKTLKEYKSLTDKFKVSV